MELLNEEARVVISEETDLIESVLLNDEEINLSDNFEEIHNVFKNIYETDGDLLIHENEFDSIEYFVNLIKEVNKDTSIKGILEPDYSYDFDFDDEAIPKVKVVEKCYLSEKIEQLACSYLICGNGRPNYDNISELKRNDINVRPGETDSFGWLSGIIDTDKGCIIFG